MVYQGDQFRQADLDPVGLQDAFAKVNATMIFGPDGGDWDISLIAKNISDVDTFSYENDSPLVDGAHHVFPDPPRTLAVRLRFRG